ncbi:MAG: Fic family protein [Acidobacteriota bacterium]
MHSLAPKALERLQLSLNDGHLLEQLGVHQGREELQQSRRPDVLSTLRSQATVESVESSNRIEGIVTSRERVLAVVRDRVEPTDRSENELAGYRDALHLIHESADGMPVSVNVLLQLHQILYQWMPAQGGRFKQVNNEIIERDPGGSTLRVRFVPTSAVETPGAMRELVRRYEQAVATQSPQPLVLIPLVILDFLCIHPFSDGNGRISRLLTLLLLFRHGYGVGRFISLERIVEESRETYYEVLERSSQRWHEAEHDPLPWMRYFWGVLLKAYREFEATLSAQPQARGAKAQLVRHAVQQQLGEFTLAQIAQTCSGVSRPTIRRVLREMRDEGLVESLGRGPGARWRRI